MGFLFHPALLSTFSREELRWENQQTSSHYKMDVLKAFQINNCMFIKCCCTLLLIFSHILKVSSLDSLVSGFLGVETLETKSNKICQTGYHQIFRNLIAIKKQNNHKSVI